MNDDRLAQIRARLDAGTPRPWYVADPRSVAAAAYPPPTDDLDETGWADWWHEATEISAGDINENDVPLIAAAPDDLRWCIERIERLETVATIARRCLDALEGESITLGTHPVLRALDVALREVGS